MFPLEYRLRPRTKIVLAGSAATLIGFALAWSAPLLGVVVGGFFFVLMVVGVLPYFLRGHRLIISAEFLQLPHGGPWFGKARRLQYADVTDVRGALDAGDTIIWFQDPSGREYAIVADLLPSQTDFELAVCTIREQLAKARGDAERVTRPKENDSDDPSV